MDTNEQSNSSDPSSLPSPFDHVIPQMVITSAEDTSEEQKNVTECTLVLIPPSNGHSIETRDKDTSAEFTGANSVSEAKHIDFEDITGVVQDVVSKCTESVSHSVSQRPLVFEVDKNTQSQESTRDSSIRCPSPPPPPPPPPPPTSSVPSPSPPSTSSPSPVVTSPTAVQRPLVFDGTVCKAEHAVETQDILVQLPTEKKEQLICDKTYQGMQIAPETPESTKLPERCATPTKKDGLHGVKKFFDSILHHESQEPTLCPEELESPKEPASPDIPKSEKGIRKFFQSSKHDATKIEKQPSSEEQSGVKESTSFTKDAKQSIKSFFDTFKHEAAESEGKSEIDISKKGIDSETNQPSSTPENLKQSTSYTKDAKQNIKAFFDTFKHEHSEQKQSDKKSSSPVDISFSSDKELSSTPESPKESTSFAKDAKQNIKAFFDTFKHESGDSKLKSTITKKAVSQPDIVLEISNEQNLDSCASENLKETKESTSFVKDAKQNIKSFFTSDVKHKDTCKKSASHSDFSKQASETDSTVRETSEISKSKESTSFAKGAKQNVKTFFDSFKHEPSASKHEDVQKKVESDQLKENIDISKDVKLSEVSKESTSPVKDTKQNIKTFFDNFKLGDVDADAKNKETSPKKSTISEPNLHKDSVETVITPKDIKQNVKAFFDNFKLGDINADAKSKDVSKTTASEPDLHKDPATELGTSKDTKQNVKAFFENFKFGDQNFDLKNKETVPKTSDAAEPALKELSETVVTSHKENKHPVKKFFSFKNAGESGECDISASLDSQLPKKSSKSKPAKVVKSVTLDLDPKYSNGSENVSASFSNMNRHEIEVVSEIKERAQSVPSDPARSKNFGVLSEIKKSEISISSLDSPDGQQPEAHKGSHQSIKKFFHSFKHEKTDVEKSSLPSVTAKKGSTKELNSIELSAEESKATEKTAKEKKSKSIRRSLSDKVSREEVVQNFKGFFDSLSHKTSSKKSLKDGEHIYDVVEVKPEVDNPIPTIHISSDEFHASTNTAKGEIKGMKKIFSPILSKDTSKSGSETIYISESKSDIKKESTVLQKKNDWEFQKSSDLSNDTTSSISAVEVSDLSPNMSEPDSPKSDKSVFDSIGENILALKERVLHTREKRKSELSDDSVKVSDASPETGDKQKEKSQNIAAMSVNDEQTKEIDRIKPAPPEKPTEIKELNKSQISTKISKDVKGQSSTNPNSLYDTCCIKLAVLLRDKALDIVTERTKSPPPKPPKPSAEAIAKARASAVYRRIEAQKSRSLGENFPVSYDGMRFADDETESSCDYKDVENFDYIMDYELINRYKIDSSKLDTFSVPSTCSGLSSYYTADTITLRDENFSDGIMETISLNSDISCSFKQLSTVTESKLSTKREAKNKVGTAFVSNDVCSIKQPTAGKKVPPPIPPKPVILQNISKIKGKADDKTVSPCVNGLSLSPRLQNKFSKDPAAIQKRPLMVADIKGTQFSSLQHPKKPPKPIRNFTTVLKNESLRTVPCVSLDGMPSTTKKVSSEDSSLQSSIKVEKRTKSPPRPPPPNIAKKPEKPPKPERPPPPLKTFKSPISDEIIEQSEKEEQTEITDTINISNEKSPKEKETDLIISLSSENTEKVSPLSNNVHELSGSECLANSDKCEVMRTLFEDTHKFDFETHQDNLNNNNQAEKNFADSLNNNIEASCSTPTEKPKPPPRNRRIRSKTVEIARTERQEEQLKRSQSLSEMDVEKRVTFLDSEKIKMDSKSLYTTVNKIGKKSSVEKTSHSSPDLVSGRPLPAPPPPPRRFRSLERKGKSKEIMNKTESEQNLNINEQVTSDHCNIKAPARRRKSDKQRFFSLHTDHRKGDIASEMPKRAESVPAKPDRRLKSSPLAKYDVNANISSFDTHQGSSPLNQNIPNAEISVTDSANCNNHKDKKDSNSRTQSYSSWYDENETLGDSWEVVDVFVHGSADEYKESPKVPVRHKSQARKKSRETSKFYINMEEEASKLPSDEKTSPLAPIDKKESPLHYVDKELSPLPLVDKETSPLPLDCSEKSVQTSLETLSQGIISRDDQSEDTDELLNLAQNLQKELSTIINRHKSVNEDTEDTPSPPLSATTSEKNLAEDFKEMKKTSSVRSSISEVWPITSSDESDVERVGEDSSNISEVSVKRKQKKIFYIAQEIMTSEEAFVDALKLLNVDFKMAVDAANKQKNMTVIPDESLAQILNHLPQLQHLNENLLMELKDRIENWDKHEKIADIIVKMGPFLKLYSWYIHDFESNVSLLEECKKKYPAFSQTVKEFEMSSRCKRLALNHYMLKPIQRIPQYRLLLQEYLHHLTEDFKDYQDTVTALQIVSEVANHANDSMKQGDNAQKLISIQNSIMGHKEIVKPGRVFIKEGELMKLSRKGMQPRWFVLFNDLLLYLTPVQQGLYRVNHELPLTGMKVAIPIQQDYQNEFSIISVTRSFTLAAKSQEERQEWIIALTKAIEENASKRSTFTNSRLQQKAQDKTSSEEESAFVLGKKAPVWIPDARVTMCQLCTSEFTVTFRRHHCRACGKVICSICSSHRISLPYLGNRIARVCDECHTRLGQGSSACTESGETDSDNQQIAVKSHLRTDNRHLKKNKRMLPSVLKEVCANDQGSTISGYLHRKTGKSWKRDWFVVKDKVLYEYKASEDIAALRSVPLLGYQIESFNEAYEGVDSSLLFQLTHPGQAPIIFYADTVGSAERWVSALKTATVLE